MKTIKELKAVFPQSPKLGPQKTTFSKGSLLRSRLDAPLKLTDNNDADYSENDAYSSKNRSKFFRPRKADRSATGLTFEEPTLPTLA